MSPPVLKHPQPSAPAKAKRPRPKTLNASSLPLPHERDGAPDTARPQREAKGVQAHKDLTQGQVDTDLHATPGLDAQQLKHLLPGSSSKSHP